MKNDELRKAVSSKDRMITKLQKQLKQLERERNVLFITLATYPRYCKLTEEIGLMMRSVDKGLYVVPPDMREVLDTADGISQLPF